MKNKITVYTTVPCVNCSETKEMMNYHNIEFEEIEVHKLSDTKQEEVLNMLREKGFTQFPVISVNDWEDSWCGYQPDKVEKYSNKFNNEIN